MFEDGRFGIDEDSDDSADDLPLPFGLPFSDQVLVNGYGETCFPNDYSPITTNDEEGSEADLVMIQDSHPML